MPGVGSGSIVERMLSKAQTELAWEEWLSAEMRAHYYADMCATLHRRQRWATWATLILSSSAAVMLLSRLEVPAWAIALVALLTAAVSLYSLVAQNPKTAAECADLQLRWNRIAMEWRDVWMNWFGDDASARLSRLLERAAEASKAGATHTVDEKRMLKWYNLVIQNRTRQHAA